MRLARVDQLRYGQCSPSHALAVQFYSATGGPTTPAEFSAIGATILAAPSLHNMARFLTLYRQACHQGEAADPEEEEAALAA